MEDSNQSNTKPLVLIVDDQPNNLRYFADAFSNQYRLSFANNGISALKILENLRPEVILLDVMMPEMDGYAVMKEISANKELKEIPVIFLTAKNETEDIVRGFELGAVDYITKPFKFKELSQRITTHINLSQAKQTIVKQNQRLEGYNQRLIEKELELITINNELDEANKEKDKFFSIIAHDLKSPFNTITGMAQVLQTQIEEKDFEDAAEFTEMIVVASQHATNLLNNLMAWSMSERGRMAFKPVELSIPEVFKKVRDSFELTLHMKKLSLDFSGPDEGVVLADKDMLETIIRNLTGNAIKYSNEDGHIHIKALKEENSWKFSVRDSGIGMNNDIQERLFRIDEVYSMKGTNGETGTGLGLILCKEMVEKHGGSIGVESSPGEGTTFTFTIPQ